jgi:Flp pilus assembly protein TadG
MMARLFLNCVRWSRGFGAARRGAAAVEFAFILPVMLVLFFGTVELSNGVAVDRKVTLTARTLSDLVSQATSVSASDLTNVFAASTAIMTPYSPTPVQAVISEIKVDNTGTATVAWSVASNATPRAVNSTVTLPTGLAVANTYLILGEATYTYTPVVGYIMKTALVMGDQFYTRPRQSNCVLYGTSSCP